MYFNVFLTKPVGVNENLGVERHQRGLNYQPPDKSSTELFEKRRFKSCRNNAFFLSASKSMVAGASPHTQLWSLQLSPRHIVDLVGIEICMVLDLPLRWKLNFCFNYIPDCTVSSMIFQKISGLTFRSRFLFLNGTALFRTWNSGSVSPVTKLSVYFLISCYIHYGPGGHMLYLLTFRL